jgi:exosortase
MKLISLRQYTYSFTTLLLLAGISLIYADTAYSYIEKWSKFDESLGHGFLIFAIVIVEIFRLSNGYIPKVEKKYHSLLLVIIFLAFAHETSTFWGILIFQQLCLYFLWLTTICYILGFNYFKRISFPLAFFLFAVPFWEFTNTFFVDLTTFAVTFFLTFSDLVVYIHQNYIETPYGIIEVAEGCSGIRYFQIGFALAVYAVQTERISLSLKILVICTGVALGIIKNWIRVLGLIYIGYYSEMTSPLMKEHDNYGLLLFFIVISSIMVLLHFLRKHYSLKEPSTENTTDNTTQKISLNNVILLKTLSAFVVISTVSFTISSTLPSEVKLKSINTTLSTQTTSILLSPSGSFTESIKNYQLMNEECSLINRTYRFTSPGTDVLPYKKLVNSANYNVTGKEQDNIIINGKAEQVIFLQLQSNHNRSRSKLYYWYQYKNYKTTNQYITKLLEISYLFNTEDKMSLNAIWCQ